MFVIKACIVDFHFQWSDGLEIWHIYLNLMTIWQTGSVILVVHPGSSLQNRTPQRLMVSTWNLVPFRKYFGSQYKYIQQRVLSATKLVQINFLCFDKFDFDLLSFVFWNTYSNNTLENKCIRMLRSKIINRNQ